MTSMANFESLNLGFLHKRGILPVVDMLCSERLHREGISLWPIQFTRYVLEDFSQVMIRLADLRQLTASTSRSVGIVF